LKNKTLTLALSAIALTAGLFTSSPALAAYPPAMNYDNFTDFVYIDESDSRMLFANKLFSMRFYMPGRDAQIRIDIVDKNGKVISTKEHVYFYQNGKALGKTKYESNTCKVKCLNGPNSPVLAPGLYWLVFSEEGKIFNSEWFEVRSYKLGEGRFAKGQVNYQYLPTTQMAKVSLDSGELRVEAGFAAGSEVGDKNSIIKKMKATLKYNGKLFAKLPGSSAHNISLEPYTEMHSINLSKAKNNSTIKKSDMKDGNYELGITLDGKAYRKFKFQVKSGKIVYQGRQKESTQPPHRMIISEKYTWLWNTYVKEPNRVMPKVNLKAATQKQAGQQRTTTTAPTPTTPRATPTPQATPKPQATPDAIDKAVDNILDSIQLPF